MGQYHTVEMRQALPSYYRISLAGSHTAHATKEEAVEETNRMMDVYAHLRKILCTARDQG